MNKLRYFILILAVSCFTVTSCNKDDDGANAVTITIIEASGTSFQDGSTVTKDLNGASSATDVALNSTITITFDRNVDGTTVTSTTIMLSSSAGNVAAGVSSNGATATLNPDDDLERGTTYTLTINGVKAEDGGNLVTTSRTFVSEGRMPVIVPNEGSMIAYWNFDANTDDATGNYTTDNVKSVDFGEDRFGQGNSTASFDGDESIIEILEGDKMMESNDFTVSFWVKTNSNGHVNENGDPANHFVFGLGAFHGFQFEIPANYSSCKLAMNYSAEDGTQVFEDLWFPGTPLDGNSWQGWTHQTDLTGSGGVPALIQDKWAQVICTYDATTKQGSMYINGDLMKRQDFNLWPDTDPKYTITGVSFNDQVADIEPILAFGFIKSADSELWANEPWGNYYVPTSNHFKGDLDDVRIFSAPFSADDAKDLYDSEKP